MSKLIILDSLDLSESERAILKVLESHTMAQRVATIARLSDTPRTTTIHTLKKLTKWKLAKAVDCGTHHRWMHNRALR